MLIEFRVENHRSLREEQALTMEAGRGGDVDDKRPRSISGHADQILPVAAIYGANASGKSNVLSALVFMRAAVLYSHRSWEPDGGVPREAFAWGIKKGEPSLFEVTVLIDSVRYQYGFLADSQSIVEEWLYAWPHGKKQVWYERDNSDFKFGENLKGENKLIEEVTRPNALFLSAAVQHKHPQLPPIFNWFRYLRPVNLPLPRYDLLLWRTASSVRITDLINGKRESMRFPDNAIENLSHRFRTMLRNADIGIIDMRVVKTESPDEPARVHPLRIQLKHKSPLSEAWLPLEEESQGTQKLFQLALPVLQTLDEGSVLIIDELEGSLHPSLAQEIVNLFNDPNKNPQNAQLIFSTHDTNLLGTTLGEPSLRRDQVWLTEKDPEGGTVLYPLTNHQPRKSENLERGYLQGRYGAIPFLGKFAWTNEESSHDQTPRSGLEASQTIPVPAPKPRLLIVCEGKVTEPKYFRGFANACKNPRVTLEIAPEAGVPLTVVKEACKHKNQAEQEAKREKDDNLEYDSVWAVFDVDEHPKIPDAIQMARDDSIHLAVSNPAFELWLLLHFRDPPGMKGRAEVRRLLDAYITGYDKHVNYEDYADGYSDAVKRATPLGACNLQTCQPGPNPSTGVHFLTESIRTE